jgi:excisionase family DNA binding protein
MPRSLPEIQPKSHDLWQIGPPGAGEVHTGHMIYITAQAAARILHVHVETLRRWHQQGKITAIRTEGGHRRYDAREVMRLAGKTVDDDDLFPWPDVPVSDASQAPQRPHILCWWARAEVRVDTHGRVHVASREIEADAEAFLWEDEDYETLQREGVHIHESSVSAYHPTFSQVEYLSQYVTIHAMDPERLDELLDDFIARSRRLLGSARPVRGIVGMELPDYNQRIMSFG